MDTVTATFMAEACRAHHRAVRDEHASDDDVEKAIRDFDNLARNVTATTAATLEDVVVRAQIVAATIEPDRDDHETRIVRALVDAVLTLGRRHGVDI